MAPHTHDYIKGLPETEPAEAGGGASTFVELTDVPASYSGQTGKQVVVKTTEDGLEFVSSVQAFDGGSFFDTNVGLVNFDAGTFI
jgi:hypothetical protein